MEWAQSSSSLLSWRVRVPKHILSTPKLRYCVPKINTHSWAACLALLKPYLNALPRLLARDCWFTSRLTGYLHPCELDTQDTVLLKSCWGVLDMEIFWLISLLWIGYDSTLNKLSEHCLALQWNKTSQNEKNRRNMQVVFGRVWENSPCKVAHFLFFFSVCAIGGNDRISAIWSLFIGEAPGTQYRTTSVARPFAENLLPLAVTTFEQHIW